MLSPLRGHGGSIRSVSFSPDGSKIISGSDDGTIRVWNASTGIGMLPPLRGQFILLHSRLMVDDMTIRVWDATTMLPPLRGHSGPIRSVAFSSDGTKIVSGSDDKTIRVWDASTGIEMLPPLRGHDNWIRSVAFSPDGLKIISGSDDNTIRVWDATTGVEVLPPLQNHDKFVFSVTFSPDGSKLISRSSDGTIRLWDTSTGIVLPPAQIAADHPRPAIGELMIGGWLENMKTGRFMGALPVGVSFHSGRVCGSTYAGWTAGYKLVLIHFPED